MEHSRRNISSLVNDKELGILRPVSFYPNVRQSYHLNSLDIWDQEDGANISRNWQNCFGSLVTTNPSTIAVSWCLCWNPRWPLIRYSRVPLPRIPGYHTLDKQARLADVHDRNVASNAWHAWLVSLARDRYPKRDRQAIMHDYRHFAIHIDII